MARVVILKDGKERGGGVHLSRTHVVAAAHTLPNAAQGQNCHVQRKDGIHEATIVDVDPPRDAILLRLSDTDLPGNPVPARRRVRARPRWAAPYGPLGPVLTGRVSTPRHEVALQAGHFVECIQLTVEQLLGSYAGYSGGPVTQPDENGAVVGMLVEQVMHRANGGNERLSSNVLLAIPQEDLWDRFAEHLRPAGLRRADGSGGFRAGRSGDSRWLLLRALQHAAEVVATPPPVRALQARRRNPKTPR